MDFAEWSNSFGAALTGYLPGILGALAILIVGWIVALIGRALVRKALGATQIDEKLAAHLNTTIKLDRVVASVVFWLILLFAIAGMFSVLRVESISGPLSQLTSTVLLYLPRLLLAAALVLIAWVLASIVRTLVNKTLASTRLDDQLSSAAGVKPISQAAGQVLFWLIILLFVPAIVGALQIEGLMAPLSNMVTELLAVLPNIVAALFIGAIGWLLAGVLRGLTSSLLAATGIDRFSRSAEGVQLSQLGGTLVFILVIVPTLVAALDALEIEVISGPAREMLSMFLTAIPNILAAAAILAIAWYLGRFVASLIERLVANLGADRLPGRLGLAQLFPMPTTSDAAAPASEPTVTFSGFIGKVAFFFIMLFATVEAAHRLGFAGVRDLLQTFIEFGADVLLGLVILAVGLWLANVAASAIQRTQHEYSTALSHIVRAAILGLVLAMGLRAMGVADRIVDLAFGLVLGALAVAVALAFGLGGREAASRLTQHWVDRYLSRSKPSQR
jgi:hypothetical protein